MDHKTWIDQLIAPDSYRAAAAKIGINQSTITKQLSKKTLKPEVIIDLAHAYGKRAGDALAATGYLSIEDLEGVGIEVALRAATNRQLLDEIERRMDVGVGDVFDEEVGTVDETREDLELTGEDDDRPHAEVHELPFRPDGVLDIDRMKGAASRRVKEVYPETPDDGV